MNKIFVSVIIIVLTIAAVAYGFIEIRGVEPICWKKYRDQPCMTTFEIIKQEFFK